MKYNQKQYHLSKESEELIVLWFQGKDRRCYSYQRSTYLRIQHKLHSLQKYLDSILSYTHLWNIYYPLKHIHIRRMLVHIFPSCTLHISMHKLVDHSQEHICHWYI